MLSANNLFKQFGPRLGRQHVGPDHGSNQFDTQIVFLKKMKKIIFEKRQGTTKKI